MIDNIIKKLNSIKNLKIKALLGFDGFIDNISHVVDKRISADNYTRIKYIKDYGERISAASGLSTNIEWILKQQKIGGNGPIMANALFNHNIDISYIGSLGYPKIDPLFEDFATKSSVISIDEPGVSDAIEFLDGKIIMGKMSFRRINYENIIKSIKTGSFNELIDKSDLFACLNWSMINNMSLIWKNIIDLNLPKLKVKDKKPIFFVDLADPQKREHKDIFEALRLLRKFKSHFKVILGLNKKEAVHICKIISSNENKLDVSKLNLERLCSYLYDYLNIDQVVIHPVDRACAFSNNKYYEVVGPYEEKPLLTTGAGDNFNAGYILGQLIGLDIESSLKTGVCSSGFYVRNARSANTNDLIEFIKKSDNQ